MANTNRDVINAAMGGSQDPNQDDYQGAAGGGQYVTVVPPTPGVYLMDFRVPANARYAGAML